MTVLKIWLAFQVVVFARDPCDRISDGSYSKDGICNGLFHIPYSEYSLCVRNHESKSWCLKSFVPISVIDAHRMRANGYSIATFDACASIHSESFVRDGGKCRRLHYLPNGDRQYCFRNEATESWCLQSFKHVMAADILDDSKFQSHYSMVISNI